MPSVCQVMRAAAIAAPGVRVAYPRRALPLSSGADAAGPDGPAAFRVGRSRV